MPTFHDARSLREMTKRPILGMVTMLPSGGAQPAAPPQCLSCSRVALSGLLASFVAVFAFAVC